jgi:hypothetical protein
MSIVTRIKAPTPKFFKTIRNIGLVLAAISGSILAAPVALPAIVVQIAGYLAVAGGVASTISQAVTNNEGQPQNTNTDYQK